MVDACQDPWHRSAMDPEDHPESLSASTRTVRLYCPDCTHAVVPARRITGVYSAARGLCAHTTLNGCLALFAACAAQAQTPATGSAEKGKQLTYTCQGCHGVTGYKNAYPTFSVPKITGQSAEYLENALTEYRKGTRKHPTMQAQAQSFSEQDIKDITAYLSSLKK